MCYTYSHKNAKGGIVMTFVIAQIIGILGMVMNIVSYQAKSKRNIILIQFFGCLLFTINMFMLKAYTGALMNLIGVIRAYTYANKDKILKFNENLSKNKDRKDIVIFSLSCLKII